MLADSDLFVASFETDGIKQFDLTSGDFIGEFAVGSGEAVPSPFGLTQGPDGNIYVASSYDHSIVRFDGATGDFIDEFVPSGSGGLHSPRDLKFGPDGLLYVASFDQNAILRFDATTGSFVDVFADMTGAVANGPSGVAEGPDGNIYVASIYSNSILRFDGTTGDFIDEFVAAGSGGLNQPQGIAFRSDGFLYVASYLTDNVLRYDADTGAFVDEFVPSGSGGLNRPRYLTFGPSGDLYVGTHFNNNVLRFDGATGAFVEEFVHAGDGGLNAVSGLAFGADGQLYVGNLWGNNVLRFDGNTGAFIDAFVPSHPELARTEGIAFGPDGHLYVVSAENSTHPAGRGKVLRFNSLTGAFIDVYAFGGLNLPLSLTFAQDGSLYVSSFLSGRVIKYNSGDGSFNDMLLEAGEGGLYQPNFLTFDASGDLLVGNQGSDNIQRYDIATGEYLGEFVEPGSGGLDYTSGIAFGPDGDLYVASLLQRAVLQYDGSTGEFVREVVASNLLEAAEGLDFGPDGNLYVATWAEGGARSKVLRFNASTGAFIDVFAFGGQRITMGIEFASDGNLYVSSYLSNRVISYDAYTGEYVDWLLQADGNGMIEPTYLALTPDGDILVGSALNDNVARFDGETGAYEGDFIAPGAGGLNHSRDILYGPDGHVYVVSIEGNSVLRFNANGDFIDVFAQSGIADPEGLAFGPDGDLFVSSRTGVITRYDGGTGAYLGMFVAFNGLNFPFGIQFGPDGNLYVANLRGSNVLRFDGVTGTFIDEFVAAGAGGLISPFDLAFEHDGDLLVSDWATGAVFRFDGVSGSLIDIPVSPGEGGLIGASGIAVRNNIIPVDIAGRIYNDLNNDGSDSGDTGLAGLAVSLTGADRNGSVNLMTTTFGDGSYVFEDVLPGTYSITAEQPLGLLDGKETAGTLGGTVDNTQDSKTIGGIVIGNDGVDAMGYNFANIQPSDLLGLVWQDFNNDGQVNFGEKAIESVAITLSGTDDRGQNVGLSTETDIDGVYLFYDLRPGEYVLSETQPAGFDDGLDIVGMVNGDPVGDSAVNDVISGIVISLPGSVAENYNFGERPPAGSAVTAGQTATIGFWQNANGQALIQSLNGDANATQLADWLGATFQNMYGASAGGNDLSGMTNSQVGSLYSDLFRRKKKEALQLGLGGPVKMDAQVLAVALATYVTNETLAGTTAESYGFLVTEHGVGTATFNVGDAGEAFDVTDYSDLAVLDLLFATNRNSHNGVLYDMDGDGDADDDWEVVLRTLANDVYSAINESGGI